jgi:predicted ester cyclase
MSIKENKKLVRRYLTPPPADVIRKAQQAKDSISVMQQGYKSVAEQFFAQDFILHMHGTDRDRDKTIEFNLALIAAFPDANFGMDKMVAEEDMVVITGRMTGTHKGAYQGIPAKGNKVDVEYLVMYRITGGKFVEAWTCMDMLGLMQQIGAIALQ